MKDKKGKAYANRKNDPNNPNDFFPTPSCMVKELLESGFFNELLDIDILDPCCGKYAIGNVLRQYGFKNITEKDLMYGQDFFADYTDNTYDVVIMNPAFKLFNSFVKKAKRISDRVYCIGKMNYFGAHDRNVNGLWEHLEWVLPFDRQIAFDKPEDENGKVECGMMITGWFIWNKNYNGYPKIKVLDMQKYIRSKKMKDLPNTDSGLFPKEYMDNPVTKVRITIDMDIREDDFVDFDIHLVEAYRKFSEITKGNITSGKVEEL